jgi:pimeloyl-ACP methyl ester carboxylesterase/predicted glycosyltransferase
MRARQPDHHGHIERAGTKIHYEVHGNGGPTILLLPTWPVVDSRVWKMQVPYLARHFRVVTFDPPGNGASDRPTEAAAYRLDAQVGYALDVLDATGTGRAVVAGLSQAATCVLDLAANHGDRVSGALFIGAGVPLVPPPDRGRFVFQHKDGPLEEVPDSAVPFGGTDPAEHWIKFRYSYWREHYEDFLWFFFGQACPEPHSSKVIEDAVGWGLETDAEVIIAEKRAFDPNAGIGGVPDPETLRDWCAQVDCPTLSIHGDRDAIAPLERAELQAELTRGDLLVVEGGGHTPQAREPVLVNLAIRDFVERAAGTGRTRRWTRSLRRPKRVLYISSPIGLGHAARDLAVARHLRERQPDVQVEWLAQDPVTRVLEAAGEQVHPASAWLVSESAHFEGCAGEHDLHAFHALRDMDEVLMANYMVFQDLVTEENFDLVVGDEAWDVDHFLHENPELKRFEYAWFTDFVGQLPMPDADDRERFLAADHNAQMIDHIERFPHLRDRAIFVGDPDDIVPDRFGPALPSIRDWTVEHYQFAGYVTGFDPARVADREALRHELGYAPDEEVCVVTVGGAGVGLALLRRVIDAFPEAKARVPGLRMVVVTGPRIDPAALPTHPGLDVRAYVPQLYRHLAASDLAVVQGGLTTCMELTATQRPFIYIPLRNHFEQNLHVHHRLQRYGAGRRLEYEDTTPEQLAETIATEIGRKVTYRPVATDGAARAADLLADLI